MGAASWGQPACTEMVKVRATGFCRDLEAEILRMWRHEPVEETMGKGMHAPGRESSRCQSPEVRVR